jgi:O-succinylbenzoate-CoA ligase
MNLGLFLTKRAHLSPGVEAYVDVNSGLRLDYAGLETRSNRTAQFLTSIGVERGDRVALLLTNSAEYIESFFAIAKLGAIVVPLNWRLVADELAFILKDSGADVLIYGDEFATTVADLQGRGPKATSVQRWIQVGGSDRRPEFADSYATLQTRAPSDLPAVEADDDDPLYIMYTSGTTGLPKGAVHTHASATWASLTCVATVDTHYRDRYLIALPLFHVGALTPMTTNVHRGATNVVMRAFDPQAAWETIEREKISNMLAVPAMLNVMYQAPNRDTHDRSYLRWIMSGAAPVPVTLIKAYAKLGIEIHQVYGLTESCGPACLITADDAVAKAGSTGKPFFHTDVRVVDDEGRDVAVGAIGEVLVRADHVMKGYWNRPEATEEVLRDGWLHTGDVASIDGDGFVYIQDRKKDMIISGGENVYPAELENVILAHPGVADVAVIGQPSERWGESPLAVVVRADSELEADDVLAHCEGKLARFKQPRAVEFVEQIPRNPAGKVLKRLLREQFPGPAPE